MNLRHNGHATQSCASSALLRAHPASPYRDDGLPETPLHHGDAAWSPGYRQSDARSVPGLQNASRKDAPGGSASNADDIFVGNITDIRLAIEGQGMVLAQRKKGDGALDDLAEVTVWFAMAFCFEHFQKFRVAIITFGGIKERPNETPRRIFCRRCVQIQAQCRKD